MKAAIRAAIIKKWVSLRLVAEKELAEFSMFSRPPKAREESEEGDRKAVGATGYSRIR